MALNACEYVLRAPALTLKGGGVLAGGLKFGSMHSQAGCGFPKLTQRNSKLRMGRCPQTWGRERCGGKGGDGKVGEAKVGRGKCNILGIFQFLLAKVLQKDLRLRKKIYPESNTPAISRSHHWQGPQ